MTGEDQLEIHHDDEAADELADRRMRLVTVLAVLFALALTIYLLWLYWPKDQDQEANQPAAVSPKTLDLNADEIPAIRFVDATTVWGIDFRHVTGAQGRKLLPETMGSGCAFFDYDNDGDPDLYLANSCSWPGAAAQSGGGCLYRNDGDKFCDVTATVGLDTPNFYGMGCAVGDYDGDGCQDLFLSAVGSNRLYRNVDGQRFENVTANTGVAGQETWSTGAAFCDYDIDGDLDLIVLNYVTWSPEIDLKQDFKLSGIGRAYGPPTGFQGTTIELFRNDGGRRFTEVAKDAGLQVFDPNTKVKVAKSLGLEICDLNDDGLPDLVVANDTVRNFVFVNEGQGRFKESGAAVGVAYDESGNARGAMGIRAGDVRNDGSLVIVVGNFANEITAFYVNEDQADPYFIDEATSAGLGAATRDSLTFGVELLDFDLDGWLDLVSANGHVEPEVSKVQKSQRHAQPPELFWNDHKKKFRQAGAEKNGADFFRPMVGRGVATADVDGDGDLDLVITANGGRPRLLINEGACGGSLRLDLRSKTSNAPALGTRVRIVTDHGPQERYLSGAGSYLSFSEPIVTFGLGQAREARAIEIRWPNGKIERIDRLPAGRHRIVASD